MVRKIKIGFLGLGVVGSRVLAMIQENQEQLREKHQVELEVCMIYVRDINKKRMVDTTGIRMTTRINDILENPEIQVCIECMGGAGTEQTLAAVLLAMEKKKHVIMSSKKCLGLYGSEIISAANQNGVQLRFEASVGGAIPICRTLMQMSKGDEIVKLYGIVNATSNYILTTMERQGDSYEEALMEAKEKGFTENDPSEDVDGWDAVYKLCILLRLGMKADVKSTQLQPVSIKNMDVNRIQEAEEQGDHIRQIIYAGKEEKSNLDCYIGPARIPKDSLLYGVNSNYNMIVIESKHSGVRAFYGEGAGGESTGSVIFDDLIDVILNHYVYEPVEAVKCHVSFDYLAVE